MGEQGATPLQELAFTLSTGIYYVTEFIKAGMNIDDFAPRLSFFFTVRGDLFEEVAKFRAGRRIWAKIMRDKFGAQDPQSWQFRFHAQTTGVELTQQQPLNNIVRSTLHTLAAVYGGAQSIHTDSYDEALWTPSSEAQQVALMTQNIIAEESGVADVIDPLGGSYYIEYLTNEMEERTWKYIERIDEMGGMLQAVKKGFIEAEITRSAIDYQKAVDSGERVVVGVNKYIVPQEEEHYPVQEKVNAELIEKQIQRTVRLKKERNQERAKEALASLRWIAETGNGNLFEATMEAAKADVTHGEIVKELREVFGFGRPSMFC
jgi:methylmalonyl-CoA mutase N-terminal domain/subunit